MPWKPSDAQNHDNAAKTSTDQKQWSEVANSVLQRTHNEGLAVREANGVIKHSEGQVH